ncbi:MAG TPA: peroxiredoxin [Bacillota bacterium]|nr:peroxiredoxin [Bacillota bacterium]
MRAPDFNLADQDSAKHSLADYAGKWLVLYFYPKDGTPGCTKEACNFRDGRELIAQLGNVEVVGISKDSVESHKKFSLEHQLNFTLLSDPSHEVIEAYGAWGGLLGTKRNTVIIGPDGEVKKQYSGVDPATHVTEIIADLKALQAGA